MELQSFGSVEFGEISVERSRWPAFALFRDQTIGKPQRLAVAILLERCGHAIGLLNGKISVMQKHVDGGRDFHVSQVVHSCKNQVASMRTSVERNESFACLGSNWLNNELIVESSANVDFSIYWR